ncbi:MAG: RNA 3'-terminal phosphate cyclase [bacterium]
MRETIYIDGSEKSGSGTIVRHCLALASIIKKDLHIINIRAKRKKPGLRPQHLKAVEACCDLTGGSAKKAIIGSDEIIFNPGDKIRYGNFNWDIGTAGSTTMMCLCLLPLGCLSDGESCYTISGGLFQDFAPNAFHMKHVLLNLLKRFSINAEIKIVKPGYVPLGRGILEVKVKPVTGNLKPLKLSEQGNIIGIKGIAISSHLNERNVSKRMADSCNQLLSKFGHEASIRIIEDESADQKGAALFIYAITDKGCIIGSDMPGRLGRSAEFIGRSVANNLLDDIRSGATVDRFAADQLVLYAGLAEGESEYIIPFMNDHIDSNLWLIKKILGAKVILKGNYLKIHGAGILRQ